MGVSIQTPDDASHDVFSWVLIFQIKLDGVYCNFHELIPTLK